MRDFSFPLLCHPSFALLVSLLLLAPKPYLLGEEPPLADDPYLLPVTTPEQKEESERLERRGTMLRWHQGLGLTTLGLLTAQVIVGYSLLSHAEEGAFGESFDRLRTAHLILGVSSFVTYLSAASLALLAPGIDRTGAFDTLTIHKSLAFVHGTGMILTPTFGFYLSKNRDRLGERYLPLARTHQIAGITTWAALFGAFLVITLK